MAGPARGPGARRTSGARPTQRRSTRPAAAVPRSRGSESPGLRDGTSHERASRSRNPSFTSRAAVLAIVVGVLAVSYAYPLRAWYDQHSRRSALEQETTSLRGSIEDLETQLALWDDPAFVRAQARERLNFVMPGEVGYVVVDESGTEQPVTTAEGIPVTAGGPWYSRLWASLEAADVPVDEPE
ncbi:MAG TPA: septum formation initiator family protein [Jiangellaceae bacterium]|nr:septum formation initiator family protein [Jiangellaceae bacterium]